MKKKQYLLWTILSLGLILRLWGVTHGYPHSFYPDEAHFVKRALSFGSGDLNPHWFHKPAFFMYMLFFNYGLFFLFGKLFHLWSTVTDFAVFYIDNPGPFYVVGRLMVAFFSMGSVIVTYLIGYRFFNKTTALIASFVMAVSYGAVISSKDIKADSACAFFTILSCYFLLVHFKNPSNKRNKWLLLSSCFAGIGAATKVYSIVMLIPIGFFILFLDKNTIPRKISNIIIQVVVFSGVYFILTPFNIIDPWGRRSTFGFFYTVYDKVALIFTSAQPETVSGVSKEVSNIHYSAFDFLIGVGNYFSKLSIGLNLAVIILAVLGLAFLLRSQFYLAIVFCLFPFIFIATSVFVNPGYADLRHQLPLYPYFALLAGFGVSQLTFIRFGFVFSSILLCGFLIHDVSRVVEADIDLSREDIRNTAQIWIEANLPAGSKILLDEEGPVLRKSEKQLKGEFKLAENAEPGPFTTHYATYLDYQLKANLNKITYDIFEIRLPWWRSNQSNDGVHMLKSKFDADMGNPLRPVGVLPYDQFKEEGYRYAVVQSRKYGPFIKNGSLSKHFPEFDEFYDSLFARGKLLKKFQGKVGAGHPDPIVDMTVCIFELQ